METPCGHLEYEPACSVRNIWKELGPEDAGGFKPCNLPHGKDGSSQGDQNRQHEKADFDGQTVVKQDT